MAVLTACDEYTCLDLANCRSLDSGAPADRSDAGDAGSGSKESLSDTTLTSAGETTSSTAGERTPTSDTVQRETADGGLEPVPTSDGFGDSATSSTSDGQASVASSEASSSSDLLVSDAGADSPDSDVCAGASCGEHAGCKPAGDSYACECERGFVGDGTVCQPAVFAVAAGFDHSCALVGEGRVRCWGGNTVARGMGLDDDGINGATDPASQLPDVNLGGARAESVSAGGHTTCVVLTDGHARCWGGNNNGEIGLVGVDALGDDESPNSSTYNVDFGADLRVLQVATGWVHTCALFDTGKVRCWGLGQHGQLGNGSTEDWGGTAERSVAKQADVRLNGRAAQIAVGQYHTCALLEGGQVVCWGDNQYGQLGLGNTVNMGDNETALEAVNLGPNTKAVQIGAGDGYTCALLDTGAVRCWGDNARGQLGIGTDTTNTGAPPSSSDQDVKLGAIAAIEHLSVGGTHSCIIYGDGKLRCWGFGGYGQLGTGNTTWAGISAETLPNSSSYDAIVGDGLRVAQVEQDVYHTCALLTTGAVRCWGQVAKCGYGQDANGYLGNIGDGTGPYPTPASAGNVPVF